MQVVPGGCTASGGAWAAAVRHAEAQDVALGSGVLVSVGDNHFECSLITQMMPSTETGLFSPLTEAETVVVDGVVADDSVSWEPLFAAWRVPQLLRWPVVMQRRLPMLRAVHRWGGPRAVRLLDALLAHVFRSVNIPQPSNARVEAALGKAAEWAGPEALVRRHSAAEL